MILTLGDYALVLILAALGSLAGIVFGSWCVRGVGALYALWDDRQWRKEQAQRMPDVLRPYKGVRK